MSGKLAMKGRSLLTIHDLTVEELTALIDLAAALKKKNRQGRRGNLLAQKNIALIFEKSSTRTRGAFVAAATDEGAHAEYLDIHNIHLGKKESVRDTARVLGRMFDGIAFRGYRQSTVETLARDSGVPVWNALTDDWHPTQILADLLTLREYFGRLKGLRVVYAGDGRNNVVNTLMVGCAMSGIDFVNCAPRELAPTKDIVRLARDLGRVSGSKLEVVHDPVTGVRGANAIYTDVWVSMGEEAKSKERQRLLMPYQVNMRMMRNTGNLANVRVIFLHCLPAFHDRNTDVTRDTGAMEVTDDVFEAPCSQVWDQAENRVHTIKALMVATLAGGRRA